MFLGFNIDINSLFAVTFAIIGMLYFIKSFIVDDKLKINKLIVLGSFCFTVSLILFVQADVKEIKNLIIEESVNNVESDKPLVESQHNR